MVYCQQQICMFGCRFHYNRGRSIMKRISLAAIGLIVVLLMTLLVSGALAGAPAAREKAYYTAFSGNTKADITFTTSSFAPGSNVSFTYRIYNTAGDYFDGDMMLRISYDDVTTADPSSWYSLDYSYLYSLSGSGSFTVPSDAKKIMVSIGIYNS